MESPDTAWVLSKHGFFPTPLRRSVSCSLAQGEMVTLSFCLIALSGVCRHAGSLFCLYGNEFKGDKIFCYLLDLQNVNPVILRGGAWESPRGRGELLKCRFLGSTLKVWTLSAISWAQEPALPAAPMADPAVRSLGNTGRLQLPPVLPGVLWCAGDGGALEGPHLPAARPPLPPCTMAPRQRL